MRENWIWHGYELEKAVDLAHCGEEVVQFSLKAKGREFDIVTKNKLIECKNRNWARLSDKAIIDEVSKLKARKVFAEQNNKIFELHSKQAIPEKVKNMLNEKEIIFIEG